MDFDRAALLTRNEREPMRDRAAASPPGDLAPAPTVRLAAARLSGDTSASRVPSGPISSPAPIVKNGAFIVLAASLPTSALAAEIRAPSCGGVDPCLDALAEVAKQGTGHTLAIRFNAGPQIAKRVAAGEICDTLISPPPAIAPAGKDGQLVAHTTTPVGRVGVGIFVRPSARCVPTWTRLHRLRSRGIDGFAENGGGGRGAHGPRVTGGQDRLRVGRRRARVGQ